MLKTKSKKNKTKATTIKATKTKTKTKIPKNTKTITTPTLYSYKKNFQQNLDKIELFSRKGNVYPFYDHEKKLVANSRTWKNTVYRKISEDRLFLITKLVSEELDDLIRLSLHLSKYRFMQKEEYLKKSSIAKMKSVAPDIIEKDFLTALKIKFHHKEQSLNAGKNYDKSKIDIFPPGLIIEWIKFYCHPFYRNRLEITDKFTLKVRRWVLYRFYNKCKSIKLDN